MSVDGTKRSFNWKWFLKVATLILLMTPVIAYFSFMPALNEGFYAPVLFSPQKYPGGWYNTKEVNHIPVEDVEFKGHQGTLHGWYFNVPGAKYTALLNHGKGGNVSWVQPEISLLTAHGMSVLAYDYGGYGRSEGKPSVKNLLQDASDAYKYLVEQKHVDPSRLILFGESLGTSVAANLSSKYPCAGVILQCPLASLQRRGCEFFSGVAIYPEVTWPENAMNMEEIFKKKHSPLLMVAGSVDKQIPTLTHGDSIFKVASEPKYYTRIEGAGHTGDIKLLGSKEYHKAVTDFMSALQ